MAFVIADRVRESSVSTGTGNFTLAGAVTGYQTFASVMATSDTTYYTIADQGGANWEVGIGTFTSPSTLARTTILSSSNGGSVVTFGAGTKDVFISLPASKTNVEDQPNLIEVNSSSAALRITQTGAGNSLVVEDSANPDATPFVVNASGQVLIGRTTAPFGSTSLAIEQSAADSAPSNIDFLKNRAGAIVNSGDGLGRIRFWGYDGAAPIAAAEIVAAVDGTPGTNDMPGRLVLNTTADGASTTTERMRIDNIGRIGINSTALTGYQFRIAGTYASTDVNPIWLGVNGTIPSTATGQAYGFFSGTATQAATFTLTGLNHFFASQGGVGAGSTLTNQYGFRANSNLTGATNNYGFYSDIASGTGRWNFYANGTADNYFAGQVQLGAGTAAAPALSTTGDTNTGIFFPAADTIAFSEGGAEIMRIDSSGNVGIGTSSPGNKLDIVSAGSSQIRVKDGVTATAYYDFGRDGTDGFFGFSGAQTTFSGYKWSVNAGTEVMRITNGGNVGIGTTTLGSKLTVNGDVAGTFFVNPTTVSANYTIPTNYNAMTAGPITVNSGITVTVPSGSTWVVT
jgi:hypothetical protein